MGLTLKCLINDSSKTSLPILLLRIYCVIEKHFGKGKKFKNFLFKWLYIDVMFLSFSKSLEFFSKDAKLILTSLQYPVHHLAARAQEKVQMEEERG